MMMTMTTTTTTTTTTQICRTRSLCMLMTSVQKSLLMSVLQSYLGAHYTIMDALIVDLIMFYYFHSYLICLKEVRQSSGMWPSCSPIRVHLEGWWVRKASSNNKQRESWAPVCFLLSNVWLTPQTWRSRKCVPPKCRSASTDLYGGHIPEGKKSKVVPVLN
jgi:hypothetical protein